MAQYLYFSNQLILGHVQLLGNLDTIFLEYPFTTLVDTLTDQNAFDGYRGHFLQFSTGFPINESEKIVCCPIWGSARFLQGSTSLTLRLRGL